MDNYVVFDLETTGISAVKDDIIEISALKVKNHEQVETFSRLVNPRRPIPAGATKVNGITDEMVQSEPGLEFILPEFLDFIDGEILIGHNIQSFDLLFLNRAADEVCRKAVLNDLLIHCLWPGPCFRVFPVTGLRIWPIILRSVQRAHTGRLTTV